MAHDPECTCPISVGDKVPDFEIPVYDPVKDDFDSFKLSANMAENRWTCLFFYPADFTFVWATEFAALAEQHDRFDRMGCELVTVSCDTQFVHLAWKHAEGELADVRYKMGSDANGRLARTFGVYLEEAGVALRGTFLIAPDGTIMNSEINQLNLGRNVDELMRRFKANIYLMKKKDEGCPAKWKEEGDATLRPSAKMVGKVHEALKK